MTDDLRKHIKKEITANVERVFHSADMLISTTKSSIGLNRVELVDLQAALATYRSLVELDRLLRLPGQDVKELPVSPQMIADKLMDAEKSMYGVFRKLVESYKP